MTLLDKIHMHFRVIFPLFLFVLGFIFYDLWLLDEPDLCLEPGKQVKIQNADIWVHLVEKNAEKGYCALVDIHHEDIWQGGGLMCRGAELKLNKRIYICTKVGKQRLEFELK